MPKKSYITFKDLRAFWDRKSDTIKLTSGDPRLAAQGWSLTLNRASRDEQILRDALTEAGVIPSEHAVAGLSAPDLPVDDSSAWGYPRTQRPGDPLTDPTNISFGVSPGREGGTMFNEENDTTTQAGPRNNLDRPGSAQITVGDVHDVSAQHESQTATTGSVLGFTLDDMLLTCAGLNGTDLMVARGVKPCMRHLNRWVDLVAYPALRDGDVEVLLHGVLSGEQMAVFNAQAEIDVLHKLPNGVGCRVQAFRQGGEIKITARILRAGGGGDGGAQVPAPVRPGPVAPPARRLLPRPGAGPRDWVDAQIEGDDRRIREGERHLVRPGVQVNLPGVPAVRPTAPTRQAGFPGEFLGTTTGATTAPLFLAPTTLDEVREAGLARVQARRALEPDEINPTGTAFAKAGEVPDKPEPGIDATMVGGQQAMKPADHRAGDGAYLGYTTRSTRTAVFFDPFQQIADNYGPATLITGAPGSGKSVMLFKTAQDLANRGVHQVIIDPRGDAISLTKTHGLGNARFLDLREGHAGLLDPLQAIGQAGVEVTRQCELALDALLMLLGGVNSPLLQGRARTMLKELIDEVSTKPKPSLNTVLQALPTKIDGRDGTLMLDIHQELRWLAKLPFGQLIFGQVKEPERLLTATLTVVTLRGLDMPMFSVAPETFTGANRLALTALYLLTAKVRQDIIAAPRSIKKAVLMDEIEMLASNPHGQKILLEMGRMGRSLQTAIILAAQRPDMFAGSQILNMAATRFVFRTQGPEQINAVLQVLNLAKNNFNRTAIRNLKTGECMLYRPNGDVITVQVEAPQPTDEDVILW